MGSRTYNVLCECLEQLPSVCLPFPRLTTSPAGAETSPTRSRPPARPIDLRELAYAGYWVIKCWPTTGPHHKIGTSVKPSGDHPGHRWFWSNRKVDQRTDEFEPNQGGLVSGLAKLVHRVHESAHSVIQLDPFTSIGKIWALNNKFPVIRLQI